MLEIVITDSELSYLVEKIEVLKDYIISFCLLLSFNKLNTRIRQIDEIGINVLDELEELNKNLDKYDSIRIWYNELDSEDLCNMYFLVDYIDNNYPNYKIYLNNVNIFALNKKELMEVKDNKYLLNEEEKKNIKNKWQNLVQENKDLRIIKNNNLVSKDFQYLDNLILNNLKIEGKVSYWSFVGNLIKTRLGGFSIDKFFTNRIDKLISLNKIKLSKIDNKDYIEFKNEE